MHECEYAHALGLSALSSRWEEWRDCNSIGTVAELLLDVIHGVRLVHHVPRPDQSNVRVLQGHYKGVTGVLQGRYKSVTRDEGRREKRGGADKQESVTRGGVRRGEEQISKRA
jgi:hypothetical protein